MKTVKTVILLLLSAWSAFATVYTYGTNTGIWAGDGSGLTNLNVTSGQTNFPYTAITNAPWVTNSSGGPTNWPFLSITNGPWTFATNGTTNQIGYGAMRSDGSGVAVGYQARGYTAGAAIGVNAQGYINGVAVGNVSTGYNNGVAIGFDSRGQDEGVSVGSSSRASQSGVAVGRLAEAYTYGAAVGYNALAYNYGAAVGYSALGFEYGSAVGQAAVGSNYGIAIGYGARGFTHGISIGVDSLGRGVGNIAIGSNATINSTLFSNTVAIGTGNATVNGALHYRGVPIVTSNGVLLGSGLLATNSTVTASNFALSYPRWIDAPGQIIPLAAGGGAVPILDVGDGTYAYVFARITGGVTYGTDKLPFNSESPHTIAQTNSTWLISNTNLYVEAHFHGRPLTAPVAPNTNAAFRIIWKACNPGMTNSELFTQNITIGLVAGSTNEMLIEFSHLNYSTNYPGIATIWTGTVTTQDPGSNQYMTQAGSGFIIRNPSFHVPVGINSVVGTYQDNAP
jgi:hypothetical protein